MKQALRIPTIKIVNPEWLAACFSQWAIVDETPYLVHVDVTNWSGRSAARDSEVEETDDTTKGKRGGKNDETHADHPLELSLLADFAADSNPQRAKAAAISTWVDQRNWPTGCTQRRR